MSLSENKKAALLVQQCGSILLLAFLIALAGTAGGQKKPRCLHSAVLFCLRELMGAASTAATAADAALTVGRACTALAVGRTCTLGAVGRMDARFMMAAAAFGVFGGFQITDFVVFLMHWFDCLV